MKAAKYVERKTDETPKNKKINKYIDELRWVLWENTMEHNPNCTQINNHPYRTLKAGGSK